MLTEFLTLCILVSVCIVRMGIQGPWDFITLGFTLSLSLSFYSFIQHEGGDHGRVETGRKTFSRLLCYSSQPIEYTQPAEKDQINQGPFLQQHREILNIELSITLHGGPHTSHSTLHFAMDSISKCCQKLNPNLEAKVISVPN